MPRHSCTRPLFSVSEVKYSDESRIEFRISHIENEMMSEYRKRAIEQLVLESSMTFKSVLVTGARQTGKSTLLSHLFPDRNAVTFDDAFLEEQAKNSPDMFLTLNAPPIILDEVQRVPELFRYLKIKCDQSEERGIYLLAGSQPVKSSPPYAWNNMR